MPACSGYPAAPPPGPASAAPGPGPAWFKPGREFQVSLMAAGAALKLALPAGPGFQAFLLSDWQQDGVLNRAVGARPQRTERGP